MYTDMEDIVNDKILNYENYISQIPEETKNFVNECLNNACSIIKRLERYPKENISVEECLKTAIVTNFFNTPFGRGFEASKKIKNVSKISFNSNYNFYDKVFDYYNILFAPMGRSYYSELKPSDIVLNIFEISDRDFLESITYDVDGTINEIKSKTQSNLNKHAKFLETMSKVINSKKIILYTKGLTINIAKVAAAYSILDVECKYSNEILTKGISKKLLEDRENVLPEHCLEEFLVSTTELAEEGLKLLGIDINNISLDEVAEVVFKKENLVGSPIEYLLDEYEIDEIFEKSGSRNVKKKELQFTAEEMEVFSNQKELRNEFYKGMDPEVILFLTNALIIKTIFSKECDYYKRLDNISGLELSILMCNLTDESKLEYYSEIVDCDKLVDIVFGGFDFDEYVISEDYYDLKSIEDDLKKILFEGNNTGLKNGDLTIEKIVGNLFNRDINNNVELSLLMHELGVKYSDFEDIDEKMVLLKERKKAESIERFRDSHKETFEFVKYCTILFNHFKENFAEEKSNELAMFASLFCYDNELRSILEARGLSKESVFKVLNISEENIVGEIDLSVYRFENFSKVSVESDIFEEYSKTNDFKYINILMEELGQDCNSVALVLKTGQSYYSKEEKLDLLISEDTNNLKLTNKEFFNKQLDKVNSFLAEHVASISEISYETIDDKKLIKENSEELKEIIESVLSQKKQGLLAKWFKKEEVEIDLSELDIKELIQKIQNYYSRQKPVLEKSMNNQKYLMKYIAAYLLFVEKVLVVLEKTRSDFNSRLNSADELEKSKLEGLISSLERKIYGLKETKLVHNIIYNQAKIAQDGTQRTFDDLGNSELTLIPKLINSITLRETVEQTVQTRKLLEDFNSLVNRVVTSNSEDLIMMSKEVEFEEANRKELTLAEERITKSIILEQGLEEKLTEVERIKQQVQNPELNSLENSGEINNGCLRVRK